MNKKDCIHTIIIINTFLSKTKDITNGVKLFPTPLVFLVLSKNVNNLDFSFLCSAGAISMCIKTTLIPRLQIWSELLLIIDVVDDSWMLLNSNGSNRSPPSHLGWDHHATHTLHATATNLTQHDERIGNSKKREEMIQAIPFPHLVSLM